MHSYSHNTIRFMPQSDYLSKKAVIDSSKVVRKHCSLPRFGTLKKHRPVSMTILDRPLNYDHRFSNHHLLKHEVPLCTPDELLDLIREPSGYYALPTDPWNEVFPDIYLSDAPTALCTGLLRRLGVTHVLNAAQGRERGLGLVNTWPGYYSQSGIHFLGVPAFDNIVFRIHTYFQDAANFIDEALQVKGRVLVHCQAGISRSATLVCAFLMLKRGMSAQDAIRTVRKKRAIIPNDGFLQQLCDLNDQLKKTPMKS